MTASDYWTTVVVLLIVQPSDVFETAKVAEKLLKITAMVYKTSGAGNWHFYKL